MNRGRLVRIGQLMKERGNKRRRTKLKATINTAFLTERLRRCLIVWLNLLESSAEEVSILMLAV